MAGSRSAEKGEESENIKPAGMTEAGETLWTPNPYQKPILLTIGSTRHPRGFSQCHSKLPALQFRLRERKDGERSK